MYNILIAGCGNIGALYDLENDQISTHAKAFSKILDFKLHFYDINDLLVNKIANKYKGEVIKKLDNKVLTKIDCFNICTPTDTHVELITKGINTNIPLIICEKPISNNQNDLFYLLNLYKKNPTKILVNYIRRFQPAYIRLKSFITTIKKNEQISNIIIRYQKGFLNNCSHALDIIEFITSSKIELKSIVIGNKNYDYFNNDPTISLLAFWGEAKVQICGLTNINYPVFELEIYYNNYKIIIKDSGNIIEYFKIRIDNQYNTLEILNDLCEYNCLKDYMSPIPYLALDFLKGKVGIDNFEGSISLNLNMIDLI
jgi:predicted dehydrogenase